MREKEREENKFQKSNSELWLLGPYVETIKQKLLNSCWLSDAKLLFERRANSTKIRVNSGRPTASLLSVTRQYFSTSKALKTGDEFCPVCDSYDIKRSLKANCNFCLQSSFLCRFVAVYIAYTRVVYTYPDSSWFGAIFLFRLPWRAASVLLSVFWNLTKFSKKNQKVSLCYFCDFLNQLR
jgi:hypothetical protein